MSDLTIDDELRATSCTMLGEIVIAFLECAIDLMAAAERDARLEELGDLIDGAREAQRLWARLASSDRTSTGLPSRSERQ